MFRQGALRLYPLRNALVNRSTIMASRIINPCTSQFMQTYAMSTVPSNNESTEGEASFFYESPTSRAAQQSASSSTATVGRLKRNAPSVGGGDGHVPPSNNNDSSPPTSGSTTSQHNDLTDSEIFEMMEDGRLKFFNLENELNSNDRAVEIRRKYIEQKTGQSIELLPSVETNFSDLYEQIKGQNCENVIGMVPIPVGVAGPLAINEKEYWIPMATTEGALIASTTRGCKALTMCGGVTARVVNSGMSRAPVLSVPNIAVAHQIKQFAEETGFNEIAAKFASTSRFARLRSLKVHIAGRKVFIRFTSNTGDAMGMNMVGKGVEKALEVILENFPSSEVIALSGNMCTDKKPSALNWIEGRGKSVVADAVIRGDVVEKVLKTNVARLVETNYAKNLLGSALAGSIGGNNAHSSNVVTAIFLATGQDPAQNVESSNCMTTMEAVNDGRDLYISVNMPSIEVGTVGGGTVLPGQNAMLNLLSVKGSDPNAPGENANTLALQVAGGVMAGELSLLSALSSGHLISSHMKLNRKPQGN